MEARKRLVVALTSTVLAGLAWTSSAFAACPGAELVAASQSEAQLESSILCLVNEERAAAGARSVTPSSQLRDAGLRHSSEMVSQGYFSHTSPAGVGFIDRILDTGYVRGGDRWVVGENLAWGTGELSSPLALVRAWMESAPHRENVLRGRFRELGIAVVRGTPTDATDQDGVTVASEYGHRAKSKGGKRGKKTRKRKARRR